MSAGAVTTGMTGTVSDGKFYSLGEDFKLIEWKLKGDRWITNEIDIAKFYDENYLIYPTNYMHSQPHDTLRLTSMKFHPVDERIAIVGDNRGWARAIDVVARKVIS